MKEILNNILTISDSKIIRTLIVVLLALLAQILSKFVISIIFNNKLGRIRKTSIHLHYQRRRLKTIGSLVKAISIFSIWFVAILIILGIFNIPLAPLLTSAGLIGAALAFGMQSIIRDLLSGIFIIFENQYRVDDYIELDKVSGRVERISMRSTAIRDDNGSIHHVPNGSIIVTTNLSMGKLHSSESIEVSSNISFDPLNKKILEISEKISEDPEYSMVVKEGPRVKSLDSITKDKMVVTLTFVTTPTKRKQASTIILNLISKSKIPLA